MISACTSMAIDVQAEIITPPGHHKMLIPRRLAVHDWVRECALLEFRDPTVRPVYRDDQRTRPHHADR